MLNPPSAARIHQANGVLNLLVAQAQPQRIDPGSKLLRGYGPVPVPVKRVERRVEVHTVLPENGAELGNELV